MEIVEGSNSLQGLGAAAARRALPGATSGRLSFPNERDARVTLRARMPGERNPTGRSMIWLDPYQPRVPGLSDATRADTVAQVNNAIYPLHAGTTDRSGAPS